MADTSGAIALTTVAILLAILVIASEATLPPTVLYLERMPSTPNHTLYHRFMGAQDQLRHSRVGRQFANRGEGTIDFPLEGLGTAGVYFTRVTLGSSRREFKVIVDTGSDIPWITCSSCNTCPQTSEEGIHFFDPSNSSTAHIFDCSEPLCVSKHSLTQCSPKNNQCVYSIKYEDGTIASGYYVSDNLVLGRSPITNSTATIVFGCSSYHNGGSIHPNIAFDGLFGFGRGALSIISQFSAKGLTPIVFSHCLRGGPIGGGTLVFGEIMEPNIVYTPLIPSRSYYGLYLERVAVNGSAMFAPRLNKEIVVDSGTTLTHLAEDSYNFLIDYITAMVSPSFTPIMSGTYQCYIVPAGFNDSDVFPMFSFIFTGGASLVLKPEQYILHKDESLLRCTIFVKSRDSISIIGELVMRDMLVVYDLARQRLGWAPFDCYRSVNVSNTGEKVNGGGQVSSIYSLSLKQLIAALTTLFLLCAF